MSDLLPYNATDAERAQANTAARISDVPIIVREMWSPDDIPVQALPWLAWAFSVDDWDTGWTEAQKRDTIKKSIVSQRIKGTIGAVRNQLAALGIDIQVQEWFNQTPAGDPYTFKLIITLDQVALNNTSLKKLIDIVNTNKNLRSHMDLVTVVSTSKVNHKKAVVSSVGSEITISNYVSPSFILNDFNVVIV